MKTTKIRIGIYQVEFKGMTLEVRQYEDGSRDWAIYIMRNGIEEWVDCVWASPTKKAALNNIVKIWG